MANRPLTVKQEAFCKWLYTPGQEVFGNPMEAARRANYKGNDNTLSTVAHENMRKPAILAERDRINANLTAVAGITDAHLAVMYLALQKRAITHDTGAAKLIAQRFDPKYTERSSQDNTHSFQGYSPSGASRSEERQRKALESSQDAPQAPIKAPPIPQPPPELSTHTGEAGGACNHVPSQAIDAQVIEQQQHTSQPTRTGSNTSADSVQETQVDTRQGGF